MTDETEGSKSPFGDVIFSYTRAQAIDDGVLFDVTGTGAERGFKEPLAISTAVHQLCLPGEKGKAAGQSYEGRLWDVIHMAFMAVDLLVKSKRNLQTDRVYFTVLFRSEDGHTRPEKLYMVRGPGDTDAAVLTIMCEGED